MVGYRLMIAIGSISQQTVEITQVVLSASCCFVVVVFLHFLNLSLYIKVNKCLLK